MNEPSSAESRSLARAALPVVALISIATFTGATLAVAGDTLGYDFLAYHAAARRLLAGGALYDMSFQAAGGFGLFYYPPLFAPLILPLGLLDVTAAAWVWIALSLASFALGVVVLPVARATRWSVVLLAGLSWPFVYAVKLGQVGPLLFLLFALGWRWLERPAVVGAVAALGAAVKLQPGLVLAWAVLTRRWRAVLAGAALLGLLALLATLIAGAGAWTDFLTLVRRVGDPVATEGNLTPGAVAYQVGAPPDVAWAVQALAMAVVVALWLATIVRGTPEASYLATVVASQAISPILWSHYALLLLLPVAWLLERRHWWAAAIPLATSTPLLGITPPATYPIAFLLVLVALFVYGRPIVPTPRAVRVAAGA